MPRETIRSLLLIDEDAAQRRLVSAIAARAGWRTIVADVGPDSLGSLSTPHGSTIEAILIDQRDDTPAMATTRRSPRLPAERSTTGPRKREQTGGEHLDPRHRRRLHVIHRGCHDRRDGHLRRPARLIRPNIRRPAATRVGRGGPHDQGAICV